MIFGMKWKNSFDPYNVLFAVATNIPMRILNGFVVQGHILESFLKDHVTLKTGVMAVELK